MKAKTPFILLIVIAGLTAPLNVSGSKESLPSRSQWSSHSFKTSDLPCELPERPARFDLTQLRTADNAYLLMSASHLAYRFWPGRRERILRQWGFTHHQFFDDPDTSTNGFWAEHGEFVLTVFRGTQEPTDLFTDVNVSLESPPEDWKMKGAVHRGFLHAALSVQKHIFIAAEYARKVQKPLIVAGHSLGGAIAVFSALQLEKKKLPIHSVWSFGAPKIGNSEFSFSARTILGSKWQKLNQPADPIPHLPFANNERDKLKSLARDYGSWVPLLETLAENASYDSLESGEIAAYNQLPVTKRPLRDIARGFLKHLPRSYVCDLAARSLAVK